MMLFTIPPAAAAALFLILLIYSLTTLEKKAGYHSFVFKLVLNLVPGSIKTFYICLLELHSLPDALVILYFLFYFLHYTNIINWTGSAQHNTGGILKKERKSHRSLCYQLYFTHSHTH